MSAPKKWTKGEIAIMTGALDSWALVNRPIPGAFAPSRGAVEVIRKHLTAELERGRKEIVLTALRSSRDTAATRYREACETVGNQIARFSTYRAERWELVPADELVERFIKIAREEDKGHKKLEALALRVHHEGLPEEVEAYDPLPKIFGP